ncbi:prenyltransferase/squalene oxidase repeat-containing protein [Streptomyces sp. NPDC020917]|uniref:prenyltransferase/squalene oxidase repeat-containing protein n=1 Tax=Streptomyces sp. NPDC020917 TaxID=3365102 RepID=UPI0037AC30E0
MRPLNDACSAPIPWPAEVDPGQVRQATSRLVAYVSNRVGPDGALQEECQSRVLESALALTLMIRTGTVSPARDRVLAFLEAQRDTSNEFNRLLAAFALGRASDREPAGDAELIAKLTEAVLGNAPEFLSARRRRMLYAVLSVLGCPLPAGVVPAADEEPPTDVVHSWAAVQQAGVTLILASAAGVSNKATDAALSTLTATRPASTVWEGYVLLHLLSLHGLAGVAGQEATVRRGLRALVRCQRHDGGFPFVMQMDNWCASTAGLALAAAGARPSVLRPMAQTLAAHRVDASQRDLYLSLSRGRPLLGGWSIGPEVAQEDVDDTACAVEFLHEVDPVAFRGPVRRGVDALLAVQNDDGGFPTYVAGGSSEPCMTAAAVNALAPFPSTAPARERALKSLVDSQLADGGFEPGWSSSRHHAMFRARLVALTADPDDRGAALMAERIERSVYETQNDDGGWGMQPGDPSDDISTASALITLCYGDRSEPVGRALAWLLAHQNADGGYSGPPDQVGPRPLSYHFPVLTDIPVLLALGHVRSRVGRTTSQLQGIA